MPRDAIEEPHSVEIITAIVKAMGEVKKVGKGGTNTHDKYNFASIDDFLALVNPICAGCGLLFHMQEIGMEDFTRKGKFGDNAWMRCTFDITAYHVSGQTLPPVRRTVEVLRNGAQAYGSAQSYALKQFLRSLLLIPTGDKDDADYAQTVEGVIEPQDRESLFDADATLGKLKEGIAKRETEDDLRAMWKAENTALGALKRSDAEKYQEVLNAFTEIKGADNGPADG